MEEASLDLKHATDSWRAVIPQTSLDVIPLPPQRDVLCSLFQKQCYDLSALLVHFPVAVQLWSSSL